MNIYDLKNAFLLEQKFDEFGNIDEDAKIYSIKDIKIESIAKDFTVRLEGETNIFEVVFIEDGIFKSAKQHINGVN